MLTLPYVRFSLLFVVTVQSLNHVWLFATTMDCSTPGLPVLHCLPKFAQIHVHWVSDDIQPFHPPLPPSPSIFIFPRIRVFSNGLLTSGGKSIGASASALVLPMIIQDSFPLGLTGLILLSKGLPRLFSSTRVGKHQFFGTQHFLWSNTHICTWLLEKPQLWL